MFMIDLGFVLFMCVLCVFFGGFFAVLCLVFVNRLLWVKHHGIDPIRVVTSSATSKPTKKDQIDVANGLDPAEWM